MKLKTLLIIISMAATLYGTAQNVTTTQVRYHNGTPVSAAKVSDTYPFAVATPSKDTLYLASNHMGKIIRNVWKADSATYVGITPVFVWKDPIWLVDYSKSK